jgi:hypothetical protein
MFQFTAFLPESLVNYFVKGRSSGLLASDGLPVPAAQWQKRCQNKKKSLQQRELLLILTGFPFKAVRLHTN